MKTFRKSIISLGCFALGAALAESLCGAATVTFANTNLTTIHDPGPFGFALATPYPSAINVSGFAPSDVIQKVTLTLHNLRHQTPDDLDMLLVGPGGQNLIVLSDAGGGFAVKSCVSWVATMAVLLFCVPNEVRPGQPVALHRPFCEWVSGLGVGHTEPGQ